MKKIRFLPLLILIPIWYWVFIMHVVHHYKQKGIENMDSVIFYQQESIGFLKKGTLSFIEIEKQKIYFFRSQADEYYKKAEDMKKWIPKFAWP